MTIEGENGHASLYYKEAKTACVSKNHLNFLTLPFDTLEMSAEHMSLIPWPDNAGGFDRNKVLFPTPFCRRGDCMGMDEEQRHELSF